MENKEIKIDNYVFNLKEIIKGKDLLYIESAFENEELSKIDKSKLFIKKLIEVYIESYYDINNKDNIIRENIYDNILEMDMYFYKTIRDKVIELNDKSGEKK